MIETKLFGFFLELIKEEKLETRFQTRPKWKQPTTKPD